MPAKLNCVGYDCFKVLLTTGTPVRPLCSMVESLYEHKYFVGRGKWVI